MTLDQVLDHVKGFGIVPTLLVLAYVHKAARPELVQVRVFFVGLYGLARAFVKSRGVTDEQIAAEQKVAEELVPQVPEVPDIAAGSLVGLITPGKKVA